jgi:subtilisin-like proprotein convertase family protein
MSARAPVVLLVCLLVPAVLAAGGVIVNPEQLPPTSVVTDRGVEVFRIADLGAATSPAWRDNADLADKDGSIPAPTDGYELSNRVIVRIADPAPLLEIAAARPQISAEPFAPVPGFWIVSADSVRAAIDLGAELAADPRVDEAYLDIRRPMVLRSGPTDPSYGLQWHLNNTLLPIADVNAEPAWNAGYTGVGVVIGILEGGWQYDHPDLAANYNADATQAGGTATYHGTSCAGVAGAVANNGLGGVGIAYGAQISGQIYGSVAQTASAFEYRNDLNHIKSNSWGPLDDGHISYMSSVEHAALEDAVLTGRGGRGEVFVWAAGNGGTGDRIDYDPYASCRYVCPIGAIGDADVRASYNETGSCLLAVAQSSGNARKIFTTTAGSAYTDTFGGTSSASPLAAGVVALMLQANPNLTWRDVQHVLVNSARRCDPAEPSWTTNAAGHWINYNYGFGAVDAYAAATCAATWTNVRPAARVNTGAIAVNQPVPDNNLAGVTQSVTLADDIRIESVELILNVTTDYVGDLRIVLTAPRGTESILALPRSDPIHNYANYTFTSRRCWDEFSKGAWTVNISDRQPANTATWTDFTLVIHGTHRPGDVNCDGLMDFDDINPFVLALVGEQSYRNQYAGCDYTLADVNGDGQVDFDDINPFVALLTQ